MPKLLCKPVCFHKSSSLKLQEQGSSPDRVPSQRQQAECCPTSPPLGQARSKPECQLKCQCKRAQAERVQVRVQAPYLTCKHPGSTNSGLTEWTW
jgi:hypothetical protein